MPSARAAAVFLALVAVAWSGGRPGSAAEPDFVGVLALALEDDVAKQLDLGADQKEKLLELVDARESEAVELALELKGLAPAERAEKLAPFRRESEARGLALLSAAQRAKLEQIRVRRLGVAALAEAEIAQRLKLTPEQHAQAAALLKKQQESRGSSGRSGMFAADAESERQLAALLTAEQRAAWAALTSAPPADTPAPSQPAAGAPAKPDAAAPPEPAKAEAPAAKEPEPEKGPARAEGAGKDEGSDAAKPSEPAAKPARLKFNFRYAPWKEVLDWFALTAGYSLEYDSLPPGTFNYTDDSEYTPAQAIDLINSVLLTKGFSLILRERMLRLHNLKDPIPPYLIADVKLEDLPKRGEFELVRVVFELKNLSPEDAQQEIQSLLGLQGSVVLLPRSRQIQVTDTAGRLRVIRDVIEAIESPGGRASGQLKIFPLKFMTCDEALSVLRQLLDLSADKNAAADGSLRVMADPGGRRIMAMGKPDKMARLGEILEAVDVADSAEAGGGAGANTLRLEVYTVVGATPDTAFQVLQTLLSGNPEVRLALDAKTGNLIAMARPAQHAIIKSTLDQLQRDARRVEVIRLRVVDPQVAVSAITKIFGGSSAGAMAPTVEANVTTRQLLVRGTDEQIKQIQSLLEQMGESSATGDEGSLDRHVRVLPITGRAARIAMERVQEVWPTVRRNPIRQVRPSAPIPSVRPSESAQGSGESAPAAASPFEDESFWEGLLGPAPSDAGRKSLPPLPGAPANSPPEQPAPDQNPKTEPAQPEQKATGPAPLPRGGARIHFAAETTEPTPAKPEQAPSPIIVAPGPGGLMIASQDAEALNAFEQLLTTLSAGASTGGTEMTIFYLKHAKAVAVAETLDQVFGGGTTASGGGGPGGGPGGLMGDLAQAAFGPMGGVVGSLLGGGGSSFTPTGPVQITPDARLNALIVKAAPADLDSIEELLKILDQKDSGDENLAEPKPRLIPVFNTQADEVAQVVRQVYQDRMVTGAGGSGGGQPPSPQQIIEMLRGGRGGRGSRRTEEVQKMSIGVDARTNSLVVCAPEALFQEVKDLVEQLDMGAIDSHQVMRVVPLEKASPAVVQRALNAIMGQGVQMGRPSTPGSTPGTSPSPVPSPIPGQSPFGFWRGPMMPGGGGSSSTPSAPQSPFGFFRSSRGMRSGFSPFGSGQPASIQPGSSSSGRRSSRSGR